jgi:hypothetical protein
VRECFCNTDVVNEHDLHTTETDFQKATYKPTQSGTEIERTRGRKISHQLKTWESRMYRESEQITRPGYEPLRNSREELQGDAQGDAESDAVSVISDTGLAKLVTLWPTLTDEVQAQILMLAGLRPDDVDDLNDVIVGDDRDRG